MCEWALGLIVLRLNVPEPPAICRRRRHHQPFVLWTIWFFFSFSLGTVSIIFIMCILSNLAQIFKLSLILLLLPPKMLMRFEWTFHGTQYAGVGMCVSFIFHYMNKVLDTSCSKSRIETKMKNFFLLTWAVWVEHTHTHVCIIAIAWQPQLGLEFIFRIILLFHRVFIYHNT